MNSLLAVPLNTDEFERAIVWTMDSEITV